MFSRDDTAGYRSLEEIEAEESGKQGDRTEIADADPAEGKPRFAPWLPFGRKEDPESKDLLAEAENRANSEEASPTYGKWWQRPFKTRDAYESDPFLAESDADPSEDLSKPNTPATRKPSAGTLAAASSKDPASDQRIAATESSKTDSKAVAKTAPKDGAIRPVSGTRTSNDDKVETADDERLVEKFEEHFRQNTLEAAEKINKAEPLIVAGKTSAEKKASDVKSQVQKTSDQKLAELEELLAERRKTAIQKTNGKQAQAKEEITSKMAATESAADEIFASAEKREAAIRKKSATVARSTDGALSSFDRLLLEASDELAPEEPVRSTTSSAKKSAPSKARTNPDNDVRVASADELFGVEGSPSTPAKTRQGTAKAKRSANSDDENDGFIWQQSQLLEEEAATEMEQQMLARAVAPRDQSKRRSKTDMAEPQFAGTPDPINDRKVAKERVEPTNVTESKASRTPFKTVSAAKSSLEKTPASVERLTTAPAALATTETGIEGDGFFTQAPLEQPVAQDQVRPATSEATAIVAPAPPTTTTPATAQFQMSSRHWMLLIGGLIVVALLFAPGSRKGLSAGHGPVHS